MNPNTVGNTQPASTENMVLNTAEQIVEKITNTTTPEASAGVLIDWSIQMLESALGLGGQAATADAVKEHVATLKANKAALATAVAATPAE